jgi:ribosomal-protein-alanine N-acetyltransferase
MHIPSSQLTFEKLSPTDFHLYTLLAMNEDVMKYITGHALTLEEAELRFRKAIDDNERSIETGFFMVRAKVNKEFIGVAKLTQITENQFEVGYMLLPEHWGKGYASEMVKCMISLARENKIAELIGIVDPENPASIKVLTKFGFNLYETGQIDGLAAAYYKLELNNILINN